MSLFIIMSVCQRGLLTLLLMQCIMRLDACPSSCKCMWKGGKQTVECINEKLISIPDSVDPGTQVLEFSDNNLQVLPRERFQRIGLLNLQRIYLSRCRISQIDDRAFKGLSNLVELDLSQNLLNTVPTETFKDYPSLMRLTFNGNPMQRVKAESFKYLIFLTTLELSNCQIELIEPDGFKGLVNLEWLKLDGNRLSNIQGAKTLPETLHGISLHNNPWQCDCRLMDLYFWLVNYKIPLPMEPNCISPARLYGETIKLLELDDLACLPDVSPTTLYLEIAEGKNVSLLCRVSAIPEARVSWWFQGRTLQNDTIVAPGIHLYYFVEEGSEEKKSELFIFNTNTDDNGTFICMAENPAGKSHSNFTIRIVMKEVPIVGKPPFPYEYMVTVSAACTVAVLLMTICGVLFTVRCQRSRHRRRKKERSKCMALQQQVPLAKASDGVPGEITRLAVDYALMRIKNNDGNVPPEAGERSTGGMSAEKGAAGGTHNVNSQRGNYTTDALHSPPSLRSCPLDRNPDLINDTESTGKERWLKGQSVNDSECGNDERSQSGKHNYQEKNENVTNDSDPHRSKYRSALHLGPWQDGLSYPRHVSTLPRGLRNENYQQHHMADVHLSPGRFLDSDGYPIDYGLPKLPTLLPINSTLSGDHSAVFYRTLPHNRPARLSMAQPTVTNSAHFPHKTDPCNSKENYECHSPTDVRYTVEGYPCSQLQSAFSHGSQGSIADVSYLPSPPAAYKGEPTLSTLEVKVVKSDDSKHLGETAATSVSWSAHQDNNLESTLQSSAAVGWSAASDGEGKGEGDDETERLRCQGSQTTVTANSPDEGYGDDAAEGTSI